MIQINNDLGKQFECKILFKDTLVGVCKTTLSFYDILCQIKKEHTKGYSMIVECEEENGDKKRYKCEISEEGKIHPAAMKNFKLWNSIIEQQLLYLHGFKNDLIYSEEVSEGHFC